MIFPKKWAFFEIFEILLPRPPQKPLFTAFLLTNFPKMTKKMLKNVSLRLRRRKIFLFSKFVPSGRVTPPISSWTFLHKAWNKYAFYLWKSVMMIIGIWTNTIRNGDSSVVHLRKGNWSGCNYGRLYLIRAWYLMSDIVAHVTSSKGQSQWWKFS